VTINKRLPELDANPFTPATNAGSFIQNATLSGMGITPTELKLVTINSQPPTHKATYTVWSPFELSGNGCNPLSSTTPDLSNRIVFFRPGSCTFAEQAKNAASYGGRYFMYETAPLDPVNDLLTSLLGITIVVR
jgi:hypothetical protein